MVAALAFGQPVDVLSAIASRHSVDLEAAEALALGAAAKDDLIDPIIFLAFLRWRAVGALLAACGNNRAAFELALSEAARLVRVGIL